MPPRDTRIYTDDKGEWRDLHTCARWERESDENPLTASAVCPTMCVPAASCSSRRRGSIAGKVTDLTRAIGILGRISDVTSSVLADDS